MNQSNDNIVSTETKFDDNELFFSITDHSSTIISGNEVFVRISGYTKEELVGQFHNIIRHPDMPRVIFKTLWEYLNNDKPVIAYVKNKTKDGQYYWVLAAVFPLNERFISIRIKPNSPIFSIVKELYFKLLMAETKVGMELSEPMLMESLNSLGYSGYDKFMSEALLCELNQRKNTLTLSDSMPKQCTDGSTELQERLQVILRYSQTLMTYYARWFEKIAMYNDVKSVFEEKGLQLRHLARDIVFLSLNASVASYKVSQGGETFGVLSSDIRINAKENDRLIGHIHTLSQSLSDTLNTFIFTVSATRIQIEMVTQFIEETLTCKSKSAIPELAENLNTLISLVSLYSEKLNALLLKMDGFIQESLNYINQLEQQVMYLGYIQVYGIIEAASNKDESIDFEGIFSQLKTLIQNTSEEIIIMEKKGLNFHTENRSLMKAAKEIEIVITQFRFEVDTIKTMDV